MIGNISACKPLTNKKYICIINPRWPPTVQNCRYMLNTFCSSDIKHTILYSGFIEDADLKKESKAEF